MAAITMASFDGPASATTTTLSLSELQDLRDAFALFDTENKGEICVQDFRACLQELQQQLEVGTTASNANLQHLLSTLNSSSGSDEQRLISEDDFVSLLTTPDPHDTRDEMEKVFDLFDVEKKGYIDVQDLHAVSDDLGDCMPESELQEMLHRASHSGHVTFEQFCDIMNRKLFS
jgi:Ca2+-binding EF-hand superfamily protein